MFFFFIIGSRERRERLGVVERYCSPCGVVRPIIVERTRRTFELFFIPLFSYGREVIAYCPVCGQEAETPGDHAI